MGKVKIKRKSTLIDMTAMSDVTVLLLTFFMLTSTFLQKEPVTVITPSSVSEIKVPEKNVASILVSPTGQVFISVAGESDETLAQEQGSEAVRKNILMKAAALYEQYTGNETGITQQDAEKFAKINMFGIPLGQMHQFLQMSQTEQDEYMSKNPAAGIPMNDRFTNQPQTNELQIWLKAIRDDSGNPTLSDQLRNGEGIAVKADKGTPYSTVKTVLENMQEMRLNRFSIMTSLKSPEN